MSLSATNTRLVIDHLPWLATARRGNPIAPGLRARSAKEPGFRISLGRQTRVGVEGCLLGQAPARDPWIPVRTVLAAGTVLRFDAVSTGFEDPCGGISDPSLVFLVEGGRWDGHSVAFFTAPTDDLGVAEGLAIAVIPQ